MNGSHCGKGPGFPEAVVLLDSLGDLHPDNTSPILVCGSHCGGNRDLAAHVKNCRVRAVFLNNAGVGKEDAGIEGIAHYEAENVVACAVDHYSAEIGIARDTHESGVISHISTKADAIGIQVGDAVRDAIKKLINHPFLTEEGGNPGASAREQEGDKKGWKEQMRAEIDGVGITVTDSITFLNEGNAGDIVVCGSHGGLSAGGYARKFVVRAVFFNDAGIGKNHAGVKSLEPLNAAGILACTVDCMSARIFDGQDTLENGIISVCNQLAKDRKIEETMTLMEAIRHI